MGSRVLWRRAATAGGMYGSVVLGVLATIVAARELSKREYGVLALALAVAGFLQILLDLTVEESLVKFGFRYVEAGRFGRLRRLYRRALVLKALGAILAGGVLAALAPFGASLFHHPGMETPLFVVAALPLAGAAETVAAPALLLRGRYDVRAGFQVVTQAFRLAALAVGAHFGVTQALVATVLGQSVASVALGLGAWRSFGHFPREHADDLGGDGRELGRFILTSSLGTGVVSLRGAISAPLLGIVANATQVGYFRIAQAPQQGFAALTAPARLILLADQTRDWERGAAAEVLASVRRFTLLAAAAMVPSVPVLYWLMPVLVKAIYGAKYAGAVEPARILMLAGAVQLAVAWTKSLPVSIGRPSLRILTHSVEAAVFIPLVVVLGERWQALGAAWAVLVSTLVFAALWLVLFVRLRRKVPALGPVAA